MWRNDQKVLYPENHNLLDENGEYKVGKGTYIHDEFTKEALGFIRDNKDKPFFLYLPYSIPHAELTVPEDSLEPYRKLNWPETPKKAGERNVGGARGKAGYGSQYVNGYCAQSRPNATYAAMVSRMDRDIGTLLDLLDELKLSDNTLVIFSSDNGPTPEGGQQLEFFNSSGELTGAKRSIYEGGIRIPFIARWPGKIEPSGVSDHPSAFWDFLPTVCDLIGTPSTEPIDGISYLPELFGDKEQPRHDYLYWQWRKREAVRVRKWKLHRTSGKFELYDLENDCGEKNNLAGAMPELVSEYQKYFSIAKGK